MTKRKWISLGIAIVALIGIAIYFAGFYPTPSERAFDKGLTYIKEEKYNILSIHKEETHGPSVFFFEHANRIGILEVAPGEDMIQAIAEKNNLSEGISLVTLAGTERHSGVLIERGDANEIQLLTLQSDGEEVAELQIEEDDQQYSGYLRESRSLSNVDTLLLTKENGEIEEIEVSY